MGEGSGVEPGSGGAWGGERVRPPRPAPFSPRSAPSLAGPRLEVGNAPALQEERRGRGQLCTRRRREAPPPRRAPPPPPPASPLPLPRGLRRGKPRPLPPLTSRLHRRASQPLSVTRRPPNCGGKGGPPFLPGGRAQETPLAPFLSRAAAIFVDGRPPVPFSSPPPLRPTSQSFFSAASKESTNSGGEETSPSPQRFQSGVPSAVKGDLRKDGGAGIGRDEGLRKRYSPSGRDGCQSH